MIYLDNNASTPLDPKVFEAMHPYLSGFAGNPSSIHSFGRNAKGALVHASKAIGRILGVRPDELLFTSGATEALNLLIRSVPRGSHVISSSLEHSAVIETLKCSGSLVSYLDPLPGSGAITANQIEKELGPNTKMIVISAANNETGVLTDLDAIGRVAMDAEVPLVVDGVAFLGKGALPIPEYIAAICFSGHKIHGPLGIGIAAVRKPFKISPLIMGGPQQRGLRGGTENLPAIIGLRAALELLEEHHEEWIAHMSHLRERFEQGLLALLPDILIHGREESRLCNTSNIAFLGVEGETLLMHLDLAGLAASHGAACSTGSLEPSRVLLNMGLGSKVARSSLRFSFSRMNTEAEIDRSIELIALTLKKM